MEQYYSVDLPENYKSDYASRMYYANRCNYCFSSKTLKKCGLCEAVTYCSRRHQLEDWSFHNPTCTAFRKIKKKVPLPEEINAKSFYKYRIELASQMAELRSLPHYSLLTEYEKQICMIPWVCPVCFKRPSKDYYCWKCLCIAYCSDEHKESDKKYHERYCWAWCMCRVLNSLDYESCYEIQGASFRYQGIAKHITEWPRDKFSLVEIIHNINIDMDQRIYLDDCINVTVFIEPYIPAALIINVFQIAEFIQKRHLTTKSQKSKSCSGRQRKLLMTREQRLSKKTSTFVIHFPIASDNELAFEWNQIAELLTDWITNINKVEIVLAGPWLEKCVIPTFGHLHKVDVIVHIMDYEKIKNLPKPDVVVILDCDRYFGIERQEQLSEEKHIKPFFKHNDVPVIFCDAHAYVITKISKFFKDFQDIKCILPCHINPFTEMKMKRVWNLGFATSIPNLNCAVFTKFK